MAAAMSQDSEVLVYVRYNHGAIGYRVRPHFKLRAVAQHFCTNRGLELGSVEFFHLGRRLIDFDTTIQAFSVQGGNVWLDATLMKEVRVA